MPRDNPDLSPDPPDVDDPFVDSLVGFDELLRRGAASPNSELSGSADPGAAGAQACLTFLERAFPRDGNDAGSPETDRIGRFELVRVLGQGGFGIVYLARDPRLGRLVALKVPRLQTVGSRTLHDRFLREARAAAALDHPHITPILETGEIGPVCYIASTYCEGADLAQWLKKHAPVAPRVAAKIVATLADATHYSHTRGILHRDLKPSNVLLAARNSSSEPLDDELPFVPRLTDFGLAKVAEEGLGETGSAVLGTPQYMAPEQAAGRTGEVCAATDVYGLGAILYELLTARPPFQGTSAAEVIDQIRSADPVPPSRLIRSIPRDLETIVQKAMAKEARERYATAQDLASDLRRFLEFRPIVARPPSLIERAVKWTRRHKSAVYSVAVAMTVLVIVGLGMAYEHSERQTKATAIVSQALEEVILKSADARAKPDDLAAWAAAMESARRAEASAAAGAVPRELRERVVGVRLDLERQHNAVERHLAEASRDQRALADFDVARMQRSRRLPDRWDYESMARRFSKAFRDYGVDLQETSVDEASRLIRGRPIRQQLMCAVLEWWSISGEEETAFRDKLLTIAEKSAFDDPVWEKSLLGALQRPDADAAMIDLADNAELPRPVLIYVCCLLDSRPDVRDSNERILKLMSKSQQRYPDDFWLNELLAVRMLLTKSGQASDRLPYLMAAVALRPGSPGAHLNLGATLSEMGRLDDALSEYRRALELDPNESSVHNNLGDLLSDRGDLDNAIAAFHRALELRPDDPDHHFNLGRTLILQGHFDEGIAEYRRTLELNPQYTKAHHNLGNALREVGQLDEAIRECHRALELEDPEWPDTHWNLAIALLQKGDFDEAIAEYRRALELKPESPDYLSGLGAALQSTGRLDEAIIEYQRALALKPDDAEILNNSANALATAGRYDEAIPGFRRAIELAPTHVNPHINLASVLRIRGEFVESLDVMRRVHELEVRNPKSRHPTQQWVVESEKLVRLAELFPKILDGSAQPVDPVDQVLLAEFALLQKHVPVIAARWYRASFDADPALAGDLARGHRYNAACAAALAADNGEAAELADDERVAWRAQARQWLLSDLKLWRQQTESTQALAEVAVKLQHWLKDSDLAGIRDDERLAALPESERKDFEALWREVADVLAKARGQASDRAK